MKYIKKQTGNGLNKSAIIIQMNVMREALRHYDRYPHIPQSLHEFAGHKLKEVRKRFTTAQLEHLSQRLLPWLQWHTGKYRRLAPFEPSEICERAMRKVFKMGYEHCLCLVILTAEFRAKPAGS